MAWAPAFQGDGAKLAPGPVVLALKSACPPLAGVSVNYGRGCEAFNRTTHETGRFVFPWWVAG